MKACSRCKTEKNESEFSKNRRNTDGLFYVCKDCSRECKKIWTEQNKEHLRNYRETDSYKKSIHKYRSTNKCKERYKEYLELNPVAKQKLIVRQFTRSQIISKKIVKLPCQVCGELKSEAHHKDYNKPLEVVWLCRKHHRELHNNIK